VNLDGFEIQDQRILPSFLFCLDQAFDRSCDEPVRKVVYRKRAKTHDETDAENGSGMKSLPTTGHKLSFAFSFLLASFVAWFNYPAGLYLFVCPAFIMALGMGKHQRKSDQKMRA